MLTLVKYEEKMVAGYKNIVNIFCVSRETMGGRIDVKVI